MSGDDRCHWDERHAADGMAPVVEHPPPPPAFAHVEHLFPRTGLALELACGRGRGAVWLAKRGMQYWGVDISPVAIGLARQLTERSGVAGQCRFEVFDLDEGLPPGPRVDLILCYLFRDRRLDSTLVDRLVPGGMLAIAVLSEVGHGPGEFRAVPGELRAAFDHLDVLDEGEEAGVAWILAHRS